MFLFIYVNLFDPSPWKPWELSSCLVYQVKAHLSVGEHRHLLALLGSAPPSDEQTLPTGVFFGGFFQE